MVVCLVPALPRVGGSAGCCVALLLQVLLATAGHAAPRTRFERVLHGPLGSRQGGAASADHPHGRAQRPTVQDRFTTSTNAPDRSGVTGALETGADQGDPSPAGGLEMSSRAPERTGSSHNTTIESLATREA